jgi:hypothetical protein
VNPAVYGASSTVTHFFESEIGFNPLLIGAVIDHNGLNYPQNLPPENLRKEQLPGLINDSRYYLFFPAANTAKA